MTKKLRILFLFLTLSITAYSQVANQPSDFIRCDQNGDGNESFFLDEKKPEILLDQNTSDYEIKFYLSALDAANGTDNFLPESYQSSVSFQTIYVRLSEISTGNYDVTSFNLIISPPIQAANFAFDRICSVSFNQQTSLYDLTSLNDDIMGNLDPSDIVISFYISEANAQSNVNPISNPENYEISFYQYYYARVENDASCFDVVPLYVANSVPPVPNDPTPLETCSTTGFATFDLNTKTPEIIDGLNLCVGCYQLSYHTSLIDAEDGTNDLNFIFTNTIQFSQTLYIRIMDEPGICYNITSLELIVNSGEIPDIGSVDVQEVCSSNLESYNLTQYEMEIRNGNADLTLEYFDDYVTLTSGGTPISDPTDYNLTLDLEEIYVKVIDNISNCYAVTVISFDYGNCAVTCDTPLNMTYCYGNYDNRKFTYTSTNGVPLVVNFNSGSIHTSDELIVKDSDGTELYNGSGNFNNNGNIYDLSGLSFQSSGSSISVEIDSNYNQNCSSSEDYELWDFDVLCSDSTGVININAFLDVNSNTVLDTTENLYAQGYLTYEKNNDGVVNTMSSSTGYFYVLSENAADSYDFNYYLYPEYENCYDLTAMSLSNISVTNGNAVTIGFPVSIEQTCEDIAVYLANEQSPRPGFNHINYLVVENLGSAETSGTVNYILDMLLSIDSVSEGNNYTVILNANGFNLDFVDLMPGERIMISILLSTPTTVSLGDLVTNTVLYSTAVDDIVFDNNISSITEEVIGSYDPNDKMESHGKDIVFDDFATSDEYLYYTIRFQNVGTAEAVNVRIEDVLDAQLDESTFHMLRSSHDYMVTRTGNGLEWEFDNINLPAEQDDAEGSNGFIYFKIKPNAGYAIGDIIENSAAIYFDFNEPIITNTFQTEFIETLSVDAFDSNSFGLFPNPAKDEVIITLNNFQVENVKITIYDVQGKRVSVSQNVKESTIQLNTSQLSSGLYFVELQNGSNKSIQKLIKE